MNGDQVRKITMKVTIVDVEHPDLYAAISSVRGLRRRSTRMRDLMFKGLLQEGGQVLPKPAEQVATQARSVGQMQGECEALPTGSASPVRVMALDETVDDMLDWET
jgi:hypothetical protein